MAPTNLIECKSLVPLIVFTIYLIALSISSSFTWKKVWLTDLIESLEYELLSHPLNLALNSETTCFALFNSRPCTSNWAFLMKCLTTTLAPSCWPFPWQKPKKLHMQVHPLVIWGYRLTKYQRALFLNCELQPFDHI